MSRKTSRKTSREEFDRSFGPDDAADALSRMKDAKMNKADEQFMVDKVVNIYQAFEKFNRDNEINLSPEADKILKVALANAPKGEGSMDVVNNGKKITGGKKRRRKRGGADCTSKDAAALLTIFMVALYNKENLSEFLLSYMPDLLSNVPVESQLRVRLLIKSISRQIESFFNGLISGLDAAITWNSTAIVKAVFDAIQNNLTVAALTSLLAYFNIKSFTDAATYAKNTVIGVPGNLYEKITGFILLLCGYIADARVMVEKAMQSSPPTSGVMATQTEAELETEADTAVENDTQLSTQKTKITDFFAKKATAGGAKKKTRKARKGKKAMKTRKGTKHKRRGRKTRRGSMGCGKHKKTKRRRR